MFKEIFCVMFIFQRLILDDESNKICVGVLHKIFQQNLFTAGYRSVKQNGFWCQWSSSSSLEPWIYAVFPTKMRRWDGSCGSNSVQWSELILREFPVLGMVSWDTVRSNCTVNQIQLQSILVIMLHHRYGFLQEATLMWMAVSIDFIPCHPVLKSQN